MNLDSGAAGHGFRDDETATLYGSLRQNFDTEVAEAMRLAAAAITTAEREALEQRLVGIDRGWHAVQVSFGMAS